MSDANMTGTALAGGLIAPALVEVLFTKGVLTRSEARNVLERASKSLALFVQTPEGYVASQVINTALREKFSERG